MLSQLRAVIAWVTAGVSFIVISALIDLDDAWDTSMAPIAALTIGVCVAGLAVELWIVSR